MRGNVHYWLGWVLEYYVYDFKSFTFSIFIKTINTFLVATLIYPIQFFHWATITWIQSRFKLFGLRINFYKKKIDCFYKNGKSKGLKIIARELGLEFDSKIRVDELRKIVSVHPAFSNSTKLLADKYGIKIVFCPKYHCELNPIEGLWCDQKQYIRKNTDQSFVTLKKLIKQSRNEFKKKKLVNKLLKRFWRVLNAYKNGAKYGDVLKTYFSGHSKANNISHLKISNLKINQ